MGESRHAEIHVWVAAQERITLRARGSVARQPARTGGRPFGGPAVKWCEAAAGEPNGRPPVHAGRPRAGRARYATPEGGLRLTPDLKVRPTDGRIASRRDPRVAVAAHERITLRARGNRGASACSNGWAT